jgi:hypothetical protein
MGYAAAASLAEENVRASEASFKIATAQYQPFFVVAKVKLN